MLNVRHPVFRLLWLGAWPLRQYLRHSPIRRGKKFLTHRFLLPMLPPPPECFLATLPGGGRVMLFYREVIGLSWLLNGGFEGAETQSLCAHARQGTLAIDVGANVGVFSIPLAQAVGLQGRVLAFEPLPLNVERLRANVDMNALGNVDICPVALGNGDGETALHLSDDPAFAATAEAVQYRPTGETMMVPAARLDSIWQERGSPEVSVLKIDVEGGELAVLEGSKGLLATCRPALLVEANTAERLDGLVRWLSGLGYVRTQPAGFMPWNHLFVRRDGQP